MKHILRVLFETHKGTFLQFMVEDLYKSIPKTVSDPGVLAFADQKSNVDRWFMWMAHVLQRRLISNPKEGETIYGMLVQIKMMSHMLSGAAATTEASEGAKPAEKARADRESRERKTLEEALQGVGRFTSRSAPGE
jgi:hypothetical protein